MGTIFNACNMPINQVSGTVPDVSGAMLDWFQSMVFTKVVKTTVGFQDVEKGTAINFRGVIQPLSARKLELKPEGQRSWTWLLLHSDRTLILNTDEVVTYLGVQTRVMARKDYSLYGYLEYELVQDWTGAGPS